MYGHNYNYISDIKITKMIHELWWLRDWKYSEPDAINKVLDMLNSPDKEMVELGLQMAEGIVKEGKKMARKSRQTMYYESTQEEETIQYEVKTN